MIYLPGTGIIASYIDPVSGELSSDFAQAISFYLWAWFILTVIFTISAMRSSWILFLDLLILSVELLLLATGYMTGSTSLLTAGNSLGFIVAFLACELNMRSDILYLPDKCGQTGRDVLVCGPEISCLSVYQHFQCTRRSSDCRALRA